MDIPDPISFLNRFGTKQRSVVQVMSRQSMPKNHVFHTKPQHAIFKTSHIQLFSKSIKTCHFHPFSLKSIKIYQFQHQASSTHTLTLYHKLQNHYLIILTHFTQVAQTQTYWHIIYSFSCQLSTTPIPLNHHCTQSISYLPSTWFNPQFNHNQSSSIYITTCIFLIHHTIKASLIIITYMTTSYISKIQQHQQFNAYLRASSLSISYHITYYIRETKTIP